MVMLQERFQRLPVGRESVGPIVLSYQLARGRKLLLDERQGSPWLPTCR
jgi:hypothetical protein